MLLCIYLQSYRIFSSDSGEFIDDTMQNFEKCLETSRVIAPKNQALNAILRGLSNYLIAGMKYLVLEMPASYVDG